MGNETLLYLYLKIVLTIGIASQQGHVITTDLTLATGQNKTSRHTLIYRGLGVETDYVHFSWF